METITINIHELNKLLQEKVKTNPFFTYHLSKELLEEVKALNMHIVTGSVGKSTKPILMDLTPEQIKEHGSGGCRLCIYEHTPIESGECRKCIKENTSNQYYL